MLLAIVCALSLTGLTKGQHWMYNQQDEWHNSCMIGLNQSPINLAEDAAKAPTNFPFIFDNYDEHFSAIVTNNGHSVHVKIEEGIPPVMSGGGLPDKYIFSEMHFHWHSEHTINSQKYPLEIHLVHFNANFARDARNHQTGIAVLAVLCQESPDDDYKFGGFIKAMQNIRNSNNASVRIEKLSLDDFLPRDRAGYYRYEGSLTTPGCEEAVIWTVFTNTISLSRKQIRQFEMVKLESAPSGTNYRELQKINGRTIYLRESPIREEKERNSASYIHGSSTISLLFMFAFMF